MGLPTGDAQPAPVAAPASGGRASPFLESIMARIDDEDRRLLRSLLAVPGPEDGRAARSRRTRMAIVDAMRVLHAEGDLRPRAADIAERAQVSRRNVWQHFADLETLLAEASRRDLELLLALWSPIAPELPLAERRDRFVRQRAGVLERMSPTWRAARLQERTSPQLQQAKQLTITLARAELLTVFAPELDALPQSRREPVVNALHAVSIWAFWESLRSEVGLDVAQATDTLAHAFAALMDRIGPLTGPGP